jgi:hypothetical protein
VAAIPGVRAVGLTPRAPLTRGNPQNNVVVEGKAPRPGEPVVVSNIRSITPGYFDAMGTPILKGRTFRASDGPDAPRVAVVDETFARHYWPNEDALGKRLSDQGDTSVNRWWTVVGVVPNVRHASLGESPSLQVYRPFAQQTPWTMYLIVRARGNHGRSYRPSAGTSRPSIRRFRCTRSDDGGSRIARSSLGA